MMICHPMSSARRISGEERNSCVSFELQMPKSLERSVQLSLLVRMLNPKVFEEPRALFDAQRGAEDVHWRHSAHRYEKIFDIKCIYVCHVYLRFVYRVSLHMT